MGQQWKALWIQGSGSRTIQKPESGGFIMIDQMNDQIVCNGERERDKSQGRFSDLQPHGDIQNIGRKK